MADPGDRNLDDLLATHGQLTADLAAAIRDLGETQRAITQRRAALWYETAGRGISERREEIATGCADLQQEADRDRAEVEALRVEVAHAGLAVQVALDGGEPHARVSLAALFRVAEQAMGAGDGDT